MYHASAFYELKAHETVACLGIGNGLWETALAATADRMHFYLNDVRPEDLVRPDITEAVRLWERLSGRAITTRLEYVQGTAQASFLPEGIFDKVIIINALHEFESLPSMMAELPRLLKSNAGSVWVEETIAQVSGQLHEGCGKRLFTQKEMLELFENHGFQLLKWQALTASQWLFAFVQK
jgi:ubiquinone/menaquinone biosynthesis C-methylase UbiE